jgi:predicted RNase H-like nuclease (RuvC/YqgF family)
MDSAQKITSNPESLNPQNIVGDILKQLRYECDTWKRELCFMQGENVRLKTRLSEILREGIDNNLLEEIEDFQNRFVREDAVIGVLRNEIAELDRLLANEVFKDGATIRKSDNKIKSLRQTIIATEKDFIRLKSEFNSYIRENI